MILTLELQGRFFKNGISRLLAHEIGHLMGSFHDTHGMLKNYLIMDANIDGMFTDSPVPCSPNEHLMSPAVGSNMSTWSSCTKKMITYAYNKREENNENCFHA